MPAYEFKEQPLYCGRSNRYGWKIYDLEMGAPVAIAAADEVLAKLTLLEGGDVLLGLTSETGEELDGGSLVVIEDRGSVNNPDPANDRPASGYAFFTGEDTEDLPDAWAAAERVKRHWLEFVLEEDATEELKSFGRGRVLVHRSS